MKNLFLRRLFHVFRLHFSVQAKCHLDLLITDCVACMSFNSQVFRLDFNHDGGEFDRRKHHSP